MIAGPTATGKSRLAMELALELETEIISADSRLIYREMNIGTDKPSESDLKKVPHHLINLVNPDQSFNAGDYKREASSLLVRLDQKELSRPIIMVGGTGLYIKAALYGLWDGPPADPPLRARFREEEEASKGSLYRRLTEIDPVSAAKIHPNDHLKMIRALEVFSLTGRPISFFHGLHRFQEARRPFILIGLKSDRENLYRRINQRVDEMIARGWVEEVKTLMEKGYDEKLPSMGSLGYNILCSYLKGMVSLDEAIFLIKRDSRRYAKRQLTWFNRDPQLRWVEREEAIGLIRETVRQASWRQGGVLI